ncbi:DUF2970 domain-containing protein [Solemya elarraichensis gill symbiont]|uniref:DUF2970 domain-containing protein n=1 Tax=Solemya elarraichensis gill symbiont TaxID=1918949 RepID=A0A1T2L445_9GAMM|nr:DUF2970 domain-containing protein [Solemya elarraichensis gill symbiont]OOZ39859.1 hypothetical protein BOW52_06735 [Solemya elarraichensis gill symbiont]
MEEKKSHKAPNLLQQLASVAAAAFGVQGSEARERDFAHGKTSNFIILGVIFTVVFILAIWGIVKLVTSLAGVN